MNIYIYLYIYLYNILYIITMYAKGQVPLPFPVSWSLITVEFYSKYGHRIRPQTLFIYLFFLQISFSHIFSYIFLRYIFLATVSPWMKIRIVIFSTDISISYSSLILFCILLAPFNCITIICCIRNYNCENVAWYLML